MFGIHDLWLFIVSGLVLNITPGPDTAYIVGRSAQFGWRGGAAAALGICTGCLVHIFCCAIGLSALLAASATAFATVKWVGAAYLCFIGIRMLLARQSTATEAEPSRHGEATPLSKVYWQGALTNILNPKVALFFLAFLPQFVDVARGRVGAQVLVLGLVFVALGLCTDGLYALAASTVAVWVRGHPHAVGGARWLSGSAYIGLGVAAALTAHRR
jgi:threonine/homoserine/homoserine lactone efflux protein